MILQQATPYKSQYIIAYGRVVISVSTIPCITIPNTAQQDLLQSI